MNWLSSAFNIVAWFACFVLFLEGLDRVTAGGAVVWRKNRQHEGFVFVALFGLAFLPYLNAIIAASMIVWILTGSDE